LTAVGRRATIAAMKQWVGYVLLALCLVIAYQGWGNVKNTPDSEERARNAACLGVRDCFLTDKRVIAFQSDVLKRRYQFETSQGPITVTCRRELYFFGAWTCTSAAGTIPGAAPAPS
jgi:hypothetical protein